MPPIETIEIDFDYVASIDELTDDHARVLRLYWAAFDRTPDPEGALYWLGQYERCAPILTIARSFTESAEFELTYGDLDDPAFIEVIYRNVLDRPSDADGARYWLDLLETDELDRAGILLYFAWSEEFSAGRPLPSDRVPNRPCRGSGPSAGERTRTFELQPWEPFATITADPANPVTLHQPAAAVELIGFHESNNDGARQMSLLSETDTAVVTLDSRNRGTGSRTAADVVVHPLTEIRSPVTGTVLRAGSYVLYCSYRDDFVVIEPDARPGYEIKVLHIDGVQVRAGDRVVAGETVLAPMARPLPFSSQIDRLTGQPAWPHVHIEVVDPTIPDRPGRGC